MFVAFVTSRGDENNEYRILFLNFLTSTAKWLFVYIQFVSTNTIDINDAHLAVTPSGSGLRISWCLFQTWILVAHTAINKLKNNNFNLSVSLTA